MYPNILTKWDLLSRKVDKHGCEAFAGMVQTRMDIKEKLHDKSLSKEEKKSLKDQAARYKLILNTTSGCMKDKFKKLYDPEYNTKMCLLGQLSLTDLIFRLAKAKPPRIETKAKPAWAIDSNTIDNNTKVDSSTKTVNENENKETLWFGLRNSNTDRNLH